LGDSNNGFFHLKEGERILSDVSEIQWENWGGAYLEQERER
jgi:hypothetical protein